MNKTLIQLKAGDHTYCMEESLAKIRYNNATFINESMDYETWYSIGAEITESLDRWEYLVYEGDKLYAELCFHIASDFHCGQCLNLLHCFVHPDHKGLLGDGFKAMRAIARALNIRYLCLTRDEGNGVYKTRYKRIANDYSKGIKADTECD